MALMLLKLGAYFGEYNKCLDGNGFLNERF